jgi:glycosyltransferase involved in cell wall biosynthesis
MSKRPLRILFVFSTRSMGGMETRAARVARLARERGHQVLFGCLPGSTLDRQLAQFRIPRFGLYIHGSADIASSLQLYRYLKRERPDVVMAFSGKDYWMTILAAKLAGTPVVLNRSTASALRSISVPVARRADAVFAVSQGIKDILVGQGMPEGLVQVIHVGVNTSVFSPTAVAPRERIRADMGIAPDAFVVGCLGRNGKGQEDLLTADTHLSAACPGVRYFFAGEEMPQHLAPLIDSRPGLRERVTVRELIPHSQIPAILRALDVVVMTPEREPFSNAVLEAMAMEKPLILSRTLGNIEAVVEGESGRLVEAGDVTAIGANLVMLYRDPVQRKTMGKRAGERVHELFSEEAMMSALERSWAAVAG